MPNDPPTDTAKQLGFAESRIFARFWICEVRKIEEQVTDPAARWDIMVRALERVARGE